VFYTARRPTSKESTETEERARPGNGQREGPSNSRQAGKAHGQQGIGGRSQQSVYASLRVRARRRLFSRKQASARASGRSQSRARLVVQHYMSADEWRIGRAQRGGDVQRLMSVSGPPAVTGGVFACEDACDAVESDDADVDGRSVLE
jgi:hypothetical protein